MVTILLELSLLYSYLSIMVVDLGTAVVGTSSSECLRRRTAVGTQVYTAVVDATKFRM